MSNYDSIMMKFQDRWTPQKVSDVITKWFWDWFRYWKCWYKTNTRMNELVHKWLLERCGTELWEDWQHFWIWRLTEKGKDYKCKKPFKLF